MEKTFSEQDSLKLINEMISQARDNFQEGNTYSSIFCGYIVAATAFANFILLHTLGNPNLSYWIWLTMIPMTIISSIISKRQRKSAIVKTHIDKIIGYIWVAFAISVGILLLSIYGTAYAFKSSHLCILITPVILIMMGAAQFITSIACRFKPYLYGACMFWCGALLCTVCYLFGRGDIQFIILGICAIMGLCVPGHIANRKAIQNV
ncbi:hypothetical protein D0T84_07305 [Dysgonomonas sp. 521]|uniref:hypothetical protein n=1 Tax=Dysgonomonas sp. 521 TaxID=2302932 RepID=UPI0013D86209|nr:hypothetical protein [Dysgonomonas sp. 521]NDV94725.1 hypothetical protein [Dysgonomonas sp. 521]